jgi:serine/threonine-protein kinase
MGGTPEYMAPEQFGDFKSVNHLADLYALGCVAYRMFTGRPPFMHEGFLQILVMHSHDAPRPPRELNADIPVALERLTLTLLAKAPSDRVQSCRELAVFIAAIRAALPG